MKKHLINYFINVIKAILIFILILAFETIKIYYVKHGLIFVICFLVIIPLFCGFLFYLMELVNKIIFKD